MRTGNLFLYFLQTFMFTTTSFSEKKNQAVKPIFPLTPLHWVCLASPLTNFYFTCSLMSLLIQYVSQSETSYNNGITSTKTREAKIIPIYHVCVCAIFIFRKLLKWKRKMLSNNENATTAKQF